LIALGPKLNGARATFFFPTQDHAAAPAIAAAAGVVYCMERSGNRDAEWCIEQTLFCGGQDRPLSMILDDEVVCLQTSFSINIPELIQR